MAINTPGSSLRINDILFRIPPQSISIIKNDYNTSASTLRAPVSTRVRSGRKDIIIVVDMLFASGYNSSTMLTEEGDIWVNQQLAPLIIQTRKCPFVSIENEKIRKEILGGELASSSGASAEQTKHINMAAVIKSITTTINAREPNIFHAQIVMQYFNYSPYSPDFAYREINSAGKSISVNTPSSLYKEFYQEGTKNGRDYLNAIDFKKGGDLELYYKEYKRLAEGEAEPLLNVGWKLETDFEAATNTRNVTISRYRKFVIKSSVDLGSGALVLESGSVSLETRVPTIPLNGHVVPTAQSLGCSDGAITLTFFANAEQDKKTKKLIGTSKKLAQLSRIFEVLSRTAVDHHRVAKNDVLLIKHPLAKLLKYKRYDETDINVYNETTGKHESFDPNDCLGCIPEHTRSQTVEGMPYCSRFTMQLTESWHSIVSNIREENIGGTARVYEATKGMLLALIKRYGIVKDPFVGFRITKEPKVQILSDLTMGTFPSNVSNNIDYSSALKLVTYLEDSRIIKELPTAEEYITDSKFLLTKSNEFSTAPNAVLSAIGGLSRADILSTRKMTAEEYDRNQQLIGKQPLSYERMNTLVSELIKLTYSSSTGKSIYPEYDEYMKEFSSINRVVDNSTYPDMILPRFDKVDGTKGYKQPDFFFYNYADTNYSKNYKKRLKPAIEKRFKEVSDQHGEKVGNQEASKEQGKDIKGSPGPATPAPNILAHDPDKAWGKERRSKTDKEFVQNPLDMKQQLAALSSSVDNFKDITYSMRRAMPTFKLYFKENEYGSLSDLEKNKIANKRGIWRNFGDLYDINSIIEIRLVKDKENPADLLVIRMTNTKEDLVNKSFKNYRSTHEEDKKDFQRRVPENSKTIGQTDMDPVMLREGTKIELRLGYDVDPNKLSVEFSGRVSRVGGGDVIEIVCQGDGVELIQELKAVGGGNEFGFNSNTSNVITKVLESSTEVKSFGSRGARTALGELDMIWNAAGGRTIVENIYAPSLFGTWDKFADKTVRYASYGAAIGSIGAVAGSLLAGAIGGAIGLAADIKDGLYTFFKGSKFVVHEQTLWDILQELTLRHPGVICGVTIFDRRSTLFFGQPDQLYFFRGPSFAEAMQLEAGRSYSSLGLVELNRREALERKLNVSNFNLNNASSRNSLLTKTGEDDKELDDTAKSLIQFMKPYRNYHFVTSQHDIVENNMIVNSDEVYNSIQVVYPNSTDSDVYNFDGSVGFAEYEKSDWIKADDDLNRDYIKRQTLVFHNAHKEVVDDLPERYAISSLCRSLNNVYKGKIKILGRPEIKPYDILFVYDTYNNIFGPVEVANVVQTISYSTGWITEITPNMIVLPANTSSYSQAKAMEKMMKSLCLRNSMLFFGGAIIGPGGEVVSDLEKKNSFAMDKARQAIAGATSGGAYAASAVIGGRIYHNYAKDVKAAKKTIKTAVEVKKASKIITTVSVGTKFVAGRLVATGIPILGDMLIDYIVGAYVSWSKYRQPIIFLPVQRNGKPWYTALHGLQTNTEWDAIKGQGKEIVKKANFLLSYLQDEFSELF